MKATYVLGGGIAGLIWAYYNKEAVVVSPEFGGQMANEFAIGPRFLHDTPDAREFLKEMDIEPKMMHVTVSYWLDGWQTREATSGFRKKYYYKSRGTLDGYDETSMNGGQSSFSALEVDFKELINKLIKAIGKKRLLKAKVIGLENDEVDGPSLTVEIKGEVGSLHYDELISTMPLNIFCKIAKIDMEPKAVPMTYVLIDSDCIAVDPISDFVYVADDRTDYHRVTFGKNRKEAVLDVRGSLTPEEVEEKFKGKAKNHVVLWNAQIVPIKELPQIPNVKFVGRYGTWDRHWKTEKVIEEAKKNAD